jgi:hypothetical protein
VIPTPRKALTDLALKLMLSIAPQTRSSYAASNTGMIGMLLQCLAQDFDRAAEMRSLDLTEMRALFTDLPASIEASLAARIDTFLATHPKSLRITDLDAHHADATHLLIELHAWAETHGSAALDRAIWDYLARHADRHAYDMPI